MEKQFLGIFEKTHFWHPFKVVLKENHEFLKELYNQYKNSKFIPDSQKYLLKFFSEEEIKTGYSEMYKLIPEGKIGYIKQTDFAKSLSDISKEMFDLAIAGKLEKQYYVNDIEDTIIYKSLTEIERLLFNVENSGAKETSTSILMQIKKLDNFGNLILDSIHENFKVSDFHISDFPKNESDWDKTTTQLKHYLVYPGGEVINKQNNDLLNRNYTAKHYALTYILDLHSKGERIPTNDGGYAKSILESIGERKMGKNEGDGFYRAVRSINKDYDLNELQDLNQISLNWKNIILELTENKDLLIKYLNSKGL